MNYREKQKKKNQTRNQLRTIKHKTDELFDKYDKIGASDSKQKDLEDNINRLFDELSSLEKQKSSIANFLENFNRRFLELAKGGEYYYEYIIEVNSTIIKT